MNVYSYIDSKDNCLENMETIQRWRESFESKGFYCRLLHEEDARGHYLWHKVVRMASILPSQNDPKYELSCWVRWLAFEHCSPGLFVDWDCLNVSLSAAHRFGGYEITALNAGNPCALYDGGFGIERFLSRFSEAYYRCRWNGDKPHCADICLFESLLPETTQWRQNRLCYNYDDPELCRARIVHFGNSNVKPEHRFKKRWMAMDEYKKWNK